MTSKGILLLLAGQSAVVWCWWAMLRCATHIVFTVEVEEHSFLPFPFGILSTTNACGEIVFQKRQVGMTKLNQKKN